MLRNHLKSAFRHYRRQSRTAVLHVVGLALGIACALVIFLAVTHEAGYDAHQSKGERIYRVETQYFKSGFTTPGTYVELAKTLRREVPQVEKVALVYHKPGQRLTRPGTTTHFDETVYFLDQNLMGLLDFEWVEGNARTAFSEPGSVVLTRAFARKIFDTEDVLGKTIAYRDQQPLLVTGVVDDYPKTTSFPLDIMVSLPTLKQVQPDYDTQGWSQYGDNSQLHILLKEGVAPDQLIKPLQDIADTHLEKSVAQERRFVLNPLSELHYTTNYSGRSANEKLLTILTVIGLIILLVACINFINLTTAQAFVRAKEVGVRKTMGSSRISLAYQFITEASLIVLVAVMLSGVLIWLSLPAVSSLLGVPLGATDLFTWKTGLFALALFFATALLAGAYPAFYLSGMAPTKILKPVKSAGSSGLLRQGLVVSQFVASFVLVCSTLIMHYQLSFFQKADLGFDKDAIITARVPHNVPEKRRSFRAKLLESPQVEQVSFSLNSLSSEGNWMENIQFRAQNKEAVDVRTQMKFADAYYVDTYGITLLAGENFREGDTLPKAIVNEVFLSRIGIEKPAQAIGQAIYLDQQALTIIGVAKDFNVNSLHQSIDPTIITYTPQYFYQSNIKLGSEGLAAESVGQSLANIEKAWKSTFPDHPFKYQFLDETLAKAYQNETRTAALIDTATLIAILIACLGLFGLSAFAAQQRTKEIGIRKVLGASIASIVALLSRDFLKLVLIAIVMASPIAWYFMNAWLADFAYKIDIGWWVFALAGGLAVGIALLTVSFQSIKAALMNPVESLRAD